MSFSLLLTYCFRSSGPVSFGFSSLEQGPPALKSMPNPGEFGVISGSPQDSSPSQNELSLQQEFNSPQVSLHERSPYVLNFCFLGT